MGGKSPLNLKYSNFLFQTSIDQSYDMIQYEYLLTEKKGSDPDSVKFIRIRKHGFIFVLSLAAQSVSSPVVLILDGNSEHVGYA